VDIVLVEHSEDEVDDQKGGRDQRGSLACEDWKARALPVKLPVNDGGAPSSDCARLIAATDCPSATPCGRLNVSVTAGNWRWWLTEREPVWRVSDIDQGGQLYRLSSGGRLDVDGFDGCGIALAGANALALDEIDGGQLAIDLIPYRDRRYSRPARCPERTGRSGRPGSWPALQ
jgi:hypothetical protein